MDANMLLSYHLERYHRICGKRHFWEEFTTWNEDKELAKRR